MAFSRVALQDKVVAIRCRSHQAIPVDIVSAKMDKECPHCDARQIPTLKKDWIEFGYEDGRIFGALCHNCGFSF